MVPRYHGTTEKGSDLTMFIIAWISCPLHPEALAWQPECPALHRRRGGHRYLDSDYYSIIKIRL